MRQMDNYLLPLDQTLTIIRNIQVASYPFHSPVDLDLTSGQCWNLCTEDT